MDSKGRAEYGRRTLELTKYPGSGIPTSEQTYAMVSIIYDRMFSEPDSEWIRVTIDEKSNLISRAQFRGLEEQGYALFKKVEE